MNIIFSQATREREFYCVTVKKRNFWRQRFMERRWYVFRGILQRKKMPWTVWNWDLSTRQRAIIQLIAFKGQWMKFTIQRCFVKMQEKFHSPWGTGQHLQWTDLFSGSNILDALEPRQIIFFCPLRIFILTVKYGNFSTALPLAQCSAFS